MIQKYRIGIIYGLLIVVLLSLQGIAATKNNNKELSTKNLRMMARVYMTVGNYEKARGLAEKAYSVAQKTSTETGEMALCMIDLATVYGNLGLLSESGRMFQSGIELQKQALFADHPYVAQTYRMLSDVQRRAGDLDKAEQSLSRAVSIMLNHCELQSKEMSPFIFESAKLYSAKGQFQEAQANYQMALDMAEQNYGSRHLMTANILESMAQCSLKRHDFEQADGYISKAMSIQRGLFGRQNPLMVDAFLTKARICRAKGQLDRSEYYLSQATASVEKNRNAITLARVYEKVNQIRNEGIAVAMAK
ncbi:MAG: tetratricopeptide repeat protein [Phycisphaerae bacterium]|nr:tetratricopeptide repeat protein [Phycisphaerae bacterium]